MSTDLLDNITEDYQKTLALRHKVLKLSRVVQQFLEEIESLVDLPFMIDATDLLNSETLFLKSEINLARELRRIEIDLIQIALKQSHGKQVEAARLLGMSPTTLNTKIKKYKIEWSK